MSHRNDPRPQVAEATYRFLLLLYPRDYRERYAGEMTELFRYCRERARARGGELRFWLATLFDLISNSLLVRLSRLRSRFGGHPFAVVPAAGSGTLAVGACCAAVCCTGHAALIGSLGITGAAIGTAAGPLRPLILGVSGLMLLVAWQLARTRGQGFTLPGEDESRRGRRRRARLGPMIAAALWLVALASPLLAELLHGH